jgi:hypothetical protein
MCLCSAKSLVRLNTHAFFRQIPQQWQAFLEQTSGRERKNALQQLSEIVSDGNATLCNDALELAGKCRTMRTAPAVLLHDCKEGIPS